MFYQDEKTPCKYFTYRALCSFPVIPLGGRVFLEIKRLLSVIYVNKILDVYRKVYRILCINLMLFQNVYYSNLRIKSI